MWFGPSQSNAMTSKMLHMNTGQGEVSYARNSSVQSTQQNRIRSLIEEAIAELCSSTNTLFPGNMMIADLGCSSGPNALALVSIAIEAIYSHRRQFQQTPAEVCLLLNDLPGNDFNLVVKDLVALRKSDGPLVVVGVVPGSFYERLFISGSLHLVCSSSCLHWLSEAPEDLRRNGIPAYDTDEHIRRERLPVIIAAYAQQFRKDFRIFLQLRAKELVPGGQMVLCLAGRAPGEVTYKSLLWEPATRALSDMASRGVIDQAKFDSFYVPLYGSSEEEVRKIIQEEGSFSIRELQNHNAMSGVDSTVLTPNKIANRRRAVYEPIIVQQFGASAEVIDEFFRTLVRQDNPLDSTAILMLNLWLTKALPE